MTTTDLSYESESATKLRAFIINTASYYTVALFLAFSVVDFLVYPSLFLEFLVVRIFVVVLIVGTVQYIERNRDLGYRVLLQYNSLQFFTATSAIYFMLYRINDPSSMYWAGLGIIAAGLSVGFAMSWQYYFFNLIVTILPLLALDINWYFETAKIDVFLNCIFLSAIGTVCAIGQRHYLRLSRAEFDNRKQLAEEVINRGRIIEIKTQESIRLNALSKQFSPQIVQSIQEGKISLSSKLHKSEICAIFVDIKDSTVKFSSLDRDDLQRVISMYIEDVMSTFLKYDITIDKFLGDGVLGFTNDPVIQVDYLERAVLAAIEIKNKIMLKQDLYNQLWKSEFQVRIGLARGEASVGFYGSDVHVKSYTAIGRVINLANRINGAAPPNEIAVSADVLNRVQQVNEAFLRDYKITDMGTVELKGFEREKLNVVLIDRVEKLSMVDDENCPHGHGPLVITQLNNGIYAMKCRYCDYVLAEETPQFIRRAA